MNCGFTKSNYTQLTEIYNRYKDKVLCLSVNFNFNFYICIYMDEKRLCNPAVIDLAGIPYFYEDLWKFNQGFCFSFILCCRPMLDFACYCNYLVAYEIAPSNTVLGSNEYVLYSYAHTLCCFSIKIPLTSFQVFHILLLN